jgi:hypothetical protein
MPVIERIVDVNLHRGRNGADEAVPAVTKEEIFLSSLSLLNAF